MDVVVHIIIGLGSAFLGLIIGKIIFSGTPKKIKWAEQEAQKIIKDANIVADQLKKDKIIDGKEHLLKLKTEFDEEVAKKKDKIIFNESKLKQFEIKLTKQAENQKINEREVAKLKEKLKAQFEHLNIKKDEYQNLIDKQTLILEKVANISAEDAKNQLVETLKDEAKTKATAYIKEIVDEAKLTASKKAKKIIIESIQRTATEHAIDNCVSVFNIESDDIKGKIIGREGRNIRALEAATGVEIIVDDTPEAIIISGFDPVRREIARLSLHRLVQDGRIHPARIEEMVSKSKKIINQEIVEIGERTIIDLGIHGLHPEMIKLVGRMRYRTSYGQNLLQHSREVANLCATMSAELGLNPKLAKRAGLLHDIGKIWTEESEKPHALVGMDLALKYNENKEVCNAIGAHHDEIEMTSLLSPIVQACDAISGSRPGARREIMEQYIKRLKDLENLAIGYEGVNKCYAIQAGRELRVMVDAENVSDKKANMLAFEISQKIEKDMQYPGQIKVTVIRETRAVSFAK